MVGSHGMEDVVVEGDGEKERIPKAEGRLTDLTKESEDDTTEQEHEDGEDVKLDEKITLLSSPPPSLPPLLHALSPLRLPPLPLPPVCEPHL